MSTTALVLPAQRVAVVGRRATCRAPRATARPAVRLARRPLRLTRRGRLLITCTAATALTGAIVAVSGAFTGATAGVHRTPPAAVHVVQPGQTLSVIAAQWSPEADWREVATDIVEINGLTSMQVLAGQHLTMPDRG